MGTSTPPGPVTGARPPDRPTAADAVGVPARPVPSRCHTVVDLASGPVHTWSYHRSARPVVVMVHGFRGDHHGLEPIAREARSLRCVIPDLPGFGATGPMPVAHDLAGYVDFLGRYLAALRLPTPPVLLGHSFGSILAAAYAAAHPEAIRALALVNPIAVAPTSGPRRLATAVTLAYYRAGAGLSDRVGGALLRSRVGVEVMSLALTKTRDPALRRAIRRQHNAYFSAFCDRATLLEAFRVSIGHTVGQDAPALRVPTLLVAGEKDDMASVADQRRLAAAIPDARLVVLPDVGHLIHYEAPAAAAAAIEDFVEGLG